MEKHTKWWEVIRKRPVLTIYILLLLICIIFVAYVGRTERPQFFSGRKSPEVRVLRTPEYETVKDNSAPQGYYYKFNIRIMEKFNGEVYLAYRMVHEYTQARIDGELIYRLYPSANNRFGRTIGNSWGMIPIYSSDRGRTLEIRIYPIYKDVHFIPDMFLVGEKSELLRGEFRQALPSLALSVLLLLVGIFYVIFSRISKFSRREGGMVLRCLGAFAIILAVWRLSDMRLTAMIFPNQTIFISYVTMLSLMLVPFPFCMYVWAKLRFNRWELWIISGFFFVLDGIILAMQFTGYRDLRENLTLIHLSDVLAMVFTVTVIFLYKLRNKKNPTELSDIIAVFLVFAGVSADLTEYYLLKSERYMVWTVLAVDIYIIFTGAHYVTKMRREASIDTATGIYNKNRCQERINEPGPAAADTMFIMCDLNGLKHVNDTQGHEAGDEMIRAFADALSSTFKDSNDFIGRYGGDEFVVILPNVWNREDASVQYIRLQDAVAEVQVLHPDIPLSFSCGYSLASENAGESLEFLLRKADMEMYLRKKAWHDQRDKMAKAAEA